MDPGQAEGAGDFVAVAGAVIGGPLVGDDARRHDLRARGDTARPAAHRLAGGQFGHGGAVADHVIHVEVVGTAIEIAVVGQHAPIQRGVVAHHARIDHADAHAGTVQPRGARGTGLGDGQVRVERRLRWLGRRRGRGGGGRRRDRWWIHPHVAAAAPAAAGAQCRCHRRDQHGPPHYCLVHPCIPVDVSSASAWSVLLDLTGDKCQACVPWPVARSVPGKPGRANARHPTFARRPGPRVPATAGTWRRHRW
ncbi:hypothetical protein D3C71_1515180 [compost metagenome]